VSSIKPIIAIRPLLGQHKTKMKMAMNYDFLKSLGAVQV